MGLYESKTVTIEAWQYDGTEKGRVRLIEMVATSAHGPVDNAHQDRIWVVFDLNEGDVRHLWIATNNGPAEIKPQHWLMKGVSDWYPCDPITFDARWELSTADEDTSLAAYAAGMPVAGITGDDETQP